MDSYPPQSLSLRWSVKLEAVWQIFLLFIVLILSWVAGFQLLGFSKDYGQYELFFDIVRGRESFIEVSTRFEPGFTFLSYILTRSSLSNAWIYGSFAFLSLFLKTRSLVTKNVSLKIGLIISIFYLSRYFAIYELTQLRAAIAISIAFYVFVQKDNVQYVWRHIALLIFAILFHYSAILFFLLYFLRRVSKFHVYVTFVSFFLISILVKLAVLKILPSVFQVFQMYANAGFGDTKASLLSSSMALDLSLVVIALFLWKKNSYSMKFSVLALTIGFAIYWSFMDFPVIAHRFREMISIFVLIYVIHALQSRFAVVRYVSYVYIMINIPFYIYLYFVHDPLLGVV